MTKQEASRILAQRARNNQRRQLQDLMGATAFDIQNLSDPQVQAKATAARKQALKALDVQRKQITSEQIALQEQIYNSQRAIKEVQQRIAAEQKVRPANQAQQLLKDNTLTNLRTQLGVQQDKVLVSQKRLTDLDLFNDYIKTRQGDFKSAIKSPPATLKPLIDFYDVIKKDLQALDKIDRETLQALNLAKGRQSKNSFDAARSATRSSIRQEIGSALQSGDPQLAAALQDPRVREAVLSGKLSLEDVRAAKGSERSQDNIFREREESQRRKFAKEESKLRPGGFRADRLNDPEVLKQITFGLVFGGPTAAAGAAIGGAFGGPSGAVIGSTLTQFVDKILSVPFEAAKETAEESKELGLALQRSILGITAIRQANIDLTTAGGRALPLDQSLKANSKEALRIQTIARQKLLPLGIAGATESTFVQGIVSALAQRGLTGSADQVARISELLGGAIVTQRPQLLDNTTLLLRDIQDVVGGGPLAQRTVLSQLIKPAFGAGLQQARTIEDVVKSLEKGLAAFPEAAKNLDNPTATINKLNSALENLKTQAGVKILDELTPSLKKLFEVLSDEKSVKFAEDLGTAFGKFTAFTTDASTAMFAFSRNFYDNVVKPLTEAIPVLVGAGAAIAAIQAASVLGLVGGGKFKGAGGVLGAAGSFLKDGAVGKLLELGVLKQVVSGPTALTPDKLAFGSLSRLGPLLNAGKFGLAGLLGFGAFSATRAVIDGKEASDEQKITDEIEARLERIRKIQQNLKPDAKFRSELGKFGLNEDFEKFSAESALPPRKSVLRNLIKLGDDFDKAGNLTTEKAQFLARAIGDNIDQSFEEEAKGKFGKGAASQFFKALEEKGTKFSKDSFAVLDRVVKKRQEELDKTKKKDPKDLQLELNAAREALVSAVNEKGVINEEQSQLKRTKEFELFQKLRLIANPDERRTITEEIDSKFRNQELELTIRKKAADKTISEARQALKDTPKTNEEATKVAEDRLNQSKLTVSEKRIAELENVLDIISKRGKLSSDIFAGISNETAAGKRAVIKGQLSDLLLDKQDLKGAIDLAKASKLPPNIEQDLRNSLAITELEEFKLKLQDIVLAGEEFIEELRGFDLESASGRKLSSEAELRGITGRLSGLNALENELQGLPDSAEKSRRLEEIRRRRTDENTRRTQAFRQRGKASIDAILEPLGGIDTGNFAGQELATRTQLSGNLAAEVESRKLVQDLKARINNGVNVDQNQQALQQEALNLARILAERSSLERSLSNILLQRKEAEIQMRNASADLKRTLSLESLQRTALVDGLKQANRALQEFKDQAKLRELGSANNILGLAKQYKGITGQQPANLPGIVAAALTSPDVEKGLQADLIQEQINAAAREADNMPQTEAETINQFNLQIKNAELAVTDFDRSIRNAIESFRIFSERMTASLSLLLDFNPTAKAIVNVTEPSKTSGSNSDGLPIKVDQGGDFGGLGPLAAPPVVGNLTPAGQKFNQEISDSVGRIPKGIRALLAAKGVKVFTGSKISDIDSSIGKQHPRGYTDPNATFDTAAGALYDPINKRVFITPTRSDYLSEAPHEIGHAFDIEVLNKFSSHKSFLSAYQSDVSRLGKKIPKGLGYFLSKTAGGDQVQEEEARKEVFAQIFAELYGPSHRKDVVEAFPSTYNLEKTYLDQISNYKNGLTGDLAINSRFGGRTLALGTGLAEPAPSWLGGGRPRKKHFQMTPILGKLLGTLGEYTEDLIPSSGTDQVIDATAGTNFSLGPDFMHKSLKGKSLLRKIIEGVDDYTVYPAQLGLGKLSNAILPPAPIFSPSEALMNSSLESLKDFTQVTSTNFGREGQKIQGFFASEDFQKLGEEYLEKTKLMKGLNTDELSPNFGKPIEGLGVSQDYYDLLPKETKDKLDPFFKSFATLDSSDALSRVTPPPPPVAAKTLEQQAEEYFKYTDSAFAQEGPPADLFGPGNSKVTTIFGEGNDSGLDRSNLLGSLSIGKPTSKPILGPANQEEAIERLEKTLSAKLDDLIKLQIELGKNAPDANGLKSIISSAAREALQSEFQ